jgi:hypothetical protein
VGGNAPKASIIMMLHATGHGDQARERIEMKCRNQPRNRSYNAEIGSSAIDFVFKPLMQRYQHANYIFAMFSPIR